jgi:hypothetical protein
MDGFSEEESYIIGFLFALMQKETKRSRLQETS